ncbi:GAF and ANTAR domain-containing protein [Allobranchiibius sp. GilTou73]|uniref:GAF and ANTAR domain-containing protein n=1 Tax=Allobranchiibius sp. GilTou73 TaxID=2904523 RepID=UPI001F2AC2D5|nr:GAF and ANTAR domain-containing protein [Allobranchiibius sp. GilTou73]UIJ35759.1 GAF and ANTAR domain-containing protein [Allobranchiibius sp. GilTou73]
MVTQQRLLDAFVELADTLVSEFDLIDFAHTLTGTAVDLLQADAAGLMLADQRGNLQLLASSSVETRTLELFELQHNEGPCVDVYRTGLPMTNIDQAEVGQRWPAFAAQVQAGTFSSVHAIPMRLRDQTIGGLNLFLTRPGHLSDRDLALAQGLADIATIGLLQERAIQEHQLLAEQLQGALNSRIVIEQAKGMLAAQHDVPISDAFTAMRSYARRSGQPLAQIARQVIDGTLKPAQLRSSAPSTGTRPGPKATPGSSA